MRGSAISLKASGECNLPGVVRAVTLAAIVLAVYLPVLQAGYIWDDDTALTENPLIRSLSGLRDIWFSTKPYDYFPLTFTSFWLEWRLWGANATGYHAVNVLLHVLGAILFWRVLLRLNIPGAWLAAMVFAVHPVCVASVAWVAERKNTLSLVFYLLSILWYLRYEDQRVSRQLPGVGREPLSAHLTRYYWLSLFAFLLALLSKTSVATLPFVLLFCLWWQRSRNCERATSSNHESTLYPAHLLPDLRRLAPFFALAFALGLVTVWFQTHRAMSGNLYQRDGLGVRLLGGTWAVWFYLAKALLPVRLSMIYPRWAVDATSVWAYFPALAWWGGLGVCWWFRRLWGRTLLFGLGCFFVTLLPVLGFFDMSFFVYSRVADHLQYLALLWVVALVVGGAGSKLKVQSPAFKVCAGLAVAVLSVLTWNRADVFKGQESLWRDTLAKNPAAWAAYNNLGMATKNPVEEFNCYLTALRLNPNYVDAHNNLGVILYQQGRREEGMAHFREALRLQPESAPAHNNLGSILVEAGNLDEAMPHLQKALRINPNYVDAHNNLGLALLRQGRKAEAATQFKTSLRLHPDQPEAHYNLGNIRFSEGNFTDAADHYRAALRARPDHFETHYNLGMALAALERWVEAGGEFNASLHLNPNFSPAQYQLGQVSLKQGNRAEAVKWFAAAVQSQPDFPEPHHRLGVILAEAGESGEAILHLRQAVRLKPDWVESLSALAWLLATEADSQFRDGNEAVRLAAHANQLTGGTNVEVLDTLAAAHAETGGFVEATRAAQQALTKARAASETNLAARIGARLRLYEARQPFRGNR